MIQARIKEKKKINKVNEEEAESKKFVCSIKSEK